MTADGKGLDALRAYAATPASFTPLESEPLLRLLIADLVGEERTRESLGALRVDLDDLRSRLHASEEAAAGLPHRREYLLIVVEFLRRLPRPPRAAGRRGGARARRCPGRWR